MTPLLVSWLAPLPVMQHADLAFPVRYLLGVPS